MMKKRFHYFRPSLSHLPHPLSHAEHEGDDKDVLMREILHEIPDPPYLLRIKSPFNYTVLQDYNLNKIREEGDLPPLVQEKGNKLRVFQIGGNQCPDLTHFLKDSVPILRLEFHQGSIRYEKPVYEMISTLKDLRKVKFFFGGGGEGEKVLGFAGDENEEEAASFQNKSVTSLTIIVAKNKKNCRQSLERSATIIQLLKKIFRRVPSLLPNVRKLTIEVPNEMGVMTNPVNEVIHKLKYLKETEIVEESGGKGGDWISVRKVEMDLINPPENLKEKEIEGSEDLSQPGEVDLENNNSDPDPSPRSDPDPEPPADVGTLLDMSKILESMLGIGIGVGSNPRSSPDLEEKGADALDDLNDNGELQFPPLPPPSPPRPIQHANHAPTNKKEEKAVVVIPEIFSKFKIPNNNNEIPN